MNIEEAIKNLKVLIGLEEFNKLSYKENKAIETLLTAYEKEKEKNKEIEKINYIKRSFDYCVEQENKKWEDKIKAKIEEVEQWKLYNKKIPRLSTLDERLGAKIGIKYVLQSLLEKE